MSGDFEPTDAILAASTTLDNELFTMALCSDVAELEKSRIFFLADDKALLKPFVEPPMFTKREPTL
tara:strand:- start:1816 stop:2013 length:198 start_codon:yes stop_codon:yes gene_type:complete